MGSSVLVLLNVQKFAVQQDGDKSLNANLVRVAMRAKGVTFWQREGGQNLAPPADSADLWPMETVWADSKRLLKDKVWHSKRWSKGIGGRGKGKHATKRQLREWTRLLVNTSRSTKSSFLVRLQKGMPKRVAKCSAKNGAAIGK